jgi:inosine/xanthosine triphosphate pyrophosphatase family protein
MKKKIFLATRNEGKIERYKKLLRQTGLDIEISTPQDFGLENIDPEENGTSLTENATIKARAYEGKVDMPILANDTGFWVRGEGLVDTPKRTALGATDERSLTRQEIAKAVLEFWRGIAHKHGGNVDAAWVESFVVLNPDGTMRIAESRREVILTDRIFGDAHLQMPVRALYLSKATNKPSILHTAEEEILEMQPVIDALLKVVTG